MPSTFIRWATPVIVGAGLLLEAQGALAAEATGTWATEDGRARVRTERCGPKNDHLCGFVVWMKEPRDKKGQLLLDGENPDPDKHKRAVLGHQMLLGLTRDEDGHFDGKVYNADNGKSYDIEVWSEAAGELTVKGCLLAVLCKTQTWARVADVSSGQLQGPTNGPGGPRFDREWTPKADLPGGTGSKPHAAGAPETTPQ